MLLFVFLTGAVALQTLPLVQWSGTTSICSFGNERKIYIDRSFALRRDDNGLTLIPPSAQEFAETFRHDLQEISGSNWTLEQSDTIPETGIFLGAFRGNSSLTYENGDSTEEAYELEIGDRIFIGGTGARGMFWGTRTLLQQLLIGNGTLPCGRAVDSPAYTTRGFMLDAGRKWYSPQFLKDMCTYASFFKMSEFHYHASDNYPLNRGRNETWYEVYSQFALRPETGALDGLIERANETLSRADFEDFQQHCAQRGVTVVPEIEAPGHALSITKWRPELALSGRRDLLNLSNPDTTPTVQAIWSEFLPWFQTKEVHIGADEYDPTLADEYITFVNDMSDFINSTSGKRVRIWGSPTDERSDHLTISTDVIVQHWQYGQSDPLELQRNRFDLINSQDWWAYVGLKNDHMPILPAPYPPFYNETRTLNFANQEGWQWNPSLFNHINTTEQLPSNSPENKGAIMAAWNDNGPDATTQLEAYYSMRRGIPLVGARSWAGTRGPNLTLSTIDETLELLSSRAPAQNLDRRVPSQLPFSWTRSSSDAECVTLGQGSKGMNYTLELDITGPFALQGPNTRLSLEPDGSLVFQEDGWQYPLRSVSEFDGFDPGYPGRIWVNASTSTHEPVMITSPANITITGDVIGGSRVWANGTFLGRFEVYVFGGRNTLFSWSQMALVLPLDTVQGGVRSISLAGSIPNRSG